MALARDVAQQLALFRALPDEERQRATAATHAVIVGIGEYGADDACRHADRDAAALASWLTGAPDEAAIGSSAGVASPKLVHRLASSGATRKGVLDALAEIARTARPEDTFVFAFAGRGTRRAGEGLAALALECRRAEGEDASKPSLLGLDALEGALAQIRARQKVVILDAGFGPGPRGRDSAPGAVMNVKAFAHALAPLAGEGGIVVAAAPPGETAQVMEAAGHGLLTYALVDGLEGAADVDGKPGVSWGELRRFVEATVPSLAALESGQAQHPVFCVVDEGRVAFPRAGE